MRDIRLAAALGASVLSLSLVGCAGADPEAAPSTPAAAVESVSSSPEPSPAPTLTATPTPEQPAAEPAILTISNHQWRNMVAAGMWRPGCPMTQQTLRRVEINHYDFSGQIQRGALVVNADVAESVARIFTRIFDAKFPIRQMVPLDAYDGDNEASMADDNTGAYNCRSATQANSPAMKSPHANGRAIDVNPFENPWQDPRCRCWSPSDEFGTNRAGPGVIVEGSPVWTAFTDEGWIWQNISVADYMHFDTGYPSKPFS